MAERQPNQHKVTVVVGGLEIGGWTEYQIDSSMIEPADRFSLQRPWLREAWDALPRDARVRVLVDGVVLIDGFIDDRKHAARAGTIAITGRDKVGRLVQDSAPSFAYDGLMLTEVVRRLAEPFFQTVTLSNARNRIVRRGHGVKAPAETEPVFLDSRTNSGRIDPGQVRWSVIQDLAARAGLNVWASADGRELVLGKPNYNQGPQFLFRASASGSNKPSTCTELEHDESNGDRYSQIVVVGSGAGDDANYGENVTSFRGEVLDGTAADGTGRDFQYPKRLILPEQGLRNAAEAQRVAEQRRRERDFRRDVVTATLPYHGQVIGGSNPTLFAPDTIARVVIEEESINAAYLIVSCRYSGSRGASEQTVCELVPSGTELVP